MGGQKSDDSAQKAQIAANAETLKFIKEIGAKAGEEAKQLFQTAEGNLQTGMQAGLNIFGQAIPQQLSTFQQGNVGAQEQLLAGLPQIQNALLGQQVDLSGLQPKQVQFDPSFFQQQLPQFQGSAPALARADETIQTQQDEAAMLAGQPLTPQQQQEANFLAATKEQLFGKRTGADRFRSRF